MTSFFISFGRNSKLSRGTTFNNRNIVVKRNWRQKGHYYFDKIWLEGKILTREEACKWLSEQLGVSEENAHFSQLSDAQCQEAIFTCQQLLNDNRRMDLDLGVKPVTPFYVL